MICVSSLHKKVSLLLSNSIMYDYICLTFTVQASDDVVRDTLYREYRKYGDISVRVMHEPDERVAYVYFRWVLTAEATGLQKITDNI